MKLAKRTFFGSRGDCVYVTNRNDCEIHQSDFVESYRRMKYVGRVWCPSVPNSNFVARRNRRIFITGNTFPPKLVERPIKASCPAEVCISCGKARERIVENNNPSLQFADRDGLVEATSVQKTSNPQSIKSMHMNIGPNGESGMYYSGKTLGWTTCSCAPQGYRPGIVLDPFAGSGTVAFVAKGLQRSSISIEIKMEYVQMIKNRINFGHDTLDGTIAWMELSA